MVQWPTLAAVGLVSGVLSGLVGTGAIAIMIVMLIVLGFSTQQAAAVSLAVQLIPATIAGVILYHKAGLLDVKASLILASGVFFGTTLGTIASVRDWIPKKALDLVMAVVLVGSGLYIGLIRIPNTV